MPRVDSLRNTIKKSRNTDSSTFATSLRNKTKTDNDIYNNIKFWEDNLYNTETGSFEKNHDPNDAYRRYYDFMDQQKKSKGGKRKSRKQRNKSRKQKR
jgi:hypothetical protein